MSKYIRGSTVDTSSSMHKSKNRDRSVSYSKGQVQNVKSARVYVFGDSDIHENEIENGNIEMASVRSRTKKGNNSHSQNSHQNDEVIYFDREIGDGDTLQSLSIQFSCPISELKRVNHLIQDQDFFGLKFIKVPVKRYGILSEQLDEQKLQGGASYNGNIEPVVESPKVFYDESDSTHDFSDPEMQMKIIRTLSIKENISDQGEEAEAFLKSMDKDLERVKNTSRGERGSLNEVISVLTNKNFFPLQPKKPEHLNGADCGMRWWTIFLTILFITIILPLGYVIYHYGFKNS